MMEEVHQEPDLGLFSGNNEKSSVGFLASLCHEIRTPVSVIQGYSELLKQQLVNLEDRKLAEAIHQNNQKLLTLLTKLGDLAAVESGSSMQYVSAYSPQKILRDAAASVQTLAENHDVHIQSVCDSSLPEFIQVDKRALSQALQQVFEQSVKLASLGEVSCDVTFNPTENQTCLTFDINIPQPIDHYIFTDQDSSSGFFPSAADSVSMSLARKLIDKMGGKFQYLCEDVGNIKIWFSLPVTVVSEKEETCHKKPSFSPRVKKTSALGKDALHDCRVLVVEDNVDNQKLISYFCERAGATVNNVFNGMIALGELLAANVMQDPYDIILMDIDMPVMDGYEATRRIRCTLDTPIIAITAHTLEGDRERCLAAGCNDYLSKPIDRKLLIETMARLVNAKSSNHTFQEVHVN